MNRRLFIVYASVFWGIVAVQAQMVVVDDFDVDPNTENATTVNPETTGWRTQGDSASISWYEDGGADDSGWLELKRTWRNANKQELGIWINVGDLEVGTTYFLRFDYRAGLAGTGTHHADAYLLYSVGENNGGIGWNNRIANLANNPPEMNGTSAFLVDQASGPTVNETVGWTTYTSSEGFQISAGTTRIWIGFQAGRFGINAATVGDNYSYLGLDNIVIVEDETVPLSGGTVIMIR